MEALQITVSIRNEKLWIKEIEAINYTPVVSNCPNLTNLWNEAVFKQERNEHSVLVTNDCWGALRTLEKHGLCKINNY